MENKLVDLSNKFQSDTLFFQNLLKSFADVKQRHDKAKINLQSLLEKFQYIPPRDSQDIKVNIFIK